MRLNLVVPAGMDSHSFEPTPADVIAIQEADILIIGGTSLTVYPAAGLIDYYRGNKLVLINMAATVRDGIADLIIKRKIGEALSEAVE